jgi:hypothetical protein
VLVCAVLALPLWANIQTNRNLFSNGTPPLTMPWGAPFADTNYTVACSAEVALKTPFLLPVITARSAASITVVPTDRDPAGILGCIAVSDTDNTPNLRHGRKAFSGNPATITVNWNTAFSDTNYTPVCTVETADPKNVSFLSVISADTPTSITINNQGIDAGTVHCLAMPFNDAGQVIHQGFATFDNNPSTVTIDWQPPFPFVEGYASTCSDIAIGGGNTSVAIEANSQTPTQVNAIPQLVQGATACLAVLSSDFATSISLSVDPPSPAPGEVVTLTAIATGEFQRRPTGSVVFLSGNQVVGTSQLVGGTRRTTLKTRFGPGTYSLTALYTGSRTSDGSFSPSQSATEVIQVNGTTPTQSTLTATPNGRNYDFDLSVFGFGFPPLAGSAVLNNLTQHTVVGDITVSGPGLSSLLAPKFASLNSAEPSGMVVADFNQDGFPDVAVTDGSNNRVLVLLGNGDGTLKPFMTTQVGSDPIGIVAGDFNNDGIPDLAVTNVGEGTVSVLQGNGNGTFKLVAKFSAGAANLITVGDFDHDGNLDLAVTETGNQQLRIFLGLGNGQFTQVEQVSIVGLPNAIVAGDFNMDGALDIALVYPGNSNTLLVLLGNGDGTFNAQNPASAGPEASGVVVGDFNGDNIPDLAVSNETGNGSVTVLLGDGKGNFTVKSTPAVGELPVGVRVTDMNGDGIDDLVVANEIDNTISVLLGEGDGNFQTQQVFAITAMPLALAVADFNGDGVPDPATVNFSGEGSVAVLLGGTLSTGSASDLPVYGIGTQQVQADFTPAEPVFAASNSNIVKVLGSGLQSTTTLSSDVNPSGYLQQVTFTATVFGMGSPTGTVDFFVDGILICAAVQLVPGQNQSTATCPIATLAVGSHTAIAKYSGDANFAPSQSSPFVQTVVHAATTTVVTANPPSPSQYGRLVTFTATVTGQFGGNPTGVVDFTDGNTAIPGCTGVALVPQGNGSTATCATSTLAVGTHQINAGYKGDSNFGISGGGIGYLVNQATTAVAFSVVPPNPQAGQVVTLTATVSSNGNVVPFGTVTFLNGKQALATVQVTQSGGIATLRTRFAPGNYTLMADYNGTNSFKPSVSSPQPLKVTGTEPTQSTLTDVPNGKNYDFTLSVFGLGFAPLSGSAEVRNLTQNEALVGNINVAGPGMQTFQAPVPYAVQPNPFEVAVADFNGDGIPDLALNAVSSHTVNILLGNGDGTFQGFKPFPAGQSPMGVATGDLNGDGIPDLVVADNGSGQVDVLLGNGDGTFQSPKTFTVGTQPIGVVVADFNGDGIADIAVANNGSNTVSVLLGNGDGTFQEQMPRSGVSFAYRMVAADFNRDGIVDLAVCSGGTNTSYVLLGNGDGTFQTPQTIQLDRQSLGIATGDFNGDGIPDLALTVFFDNKVRVLLGNGDGSFQFKSDNSVDNTPTGVTVGDFNGDGLLDLAVSNTNFHTVSILLGNGDGTFQPQQSHEAGNGALGLAATDLNGDGVPDVAVANQTGSVSVLIGGTLSAGTVTNIPVVGIGPQKVHSTFTPTGTFFAGSDSNVLSLQGSGQVPTVTTITSSLNPSSYLQPVTFSASVQGNGATPTGTLTFTDASNNNVVLCDKVPLNADAFAFCPNISNLAVGSHIIRGSYSGDNNFNPSVGNLNPPQQVNKAAASVAMTSAPNPSTYLQLVTITTTITGAFGGNPTGTVNFSDNGTTIPGCGAVVLVPQQNGSTAACQTNTLSAGVHSAIAASYNGDSNFLASASTLAPPQVVNRAQTTSVLDAQPPNNAPFGQQVTFTVAVSGQFGGSPTGVVSFSDNNVVIPACNAVALVPKQQGSIATCQTSTLAPGSHGINTAYDGDNNYGPSGGSIDYSITPAGTTVTLTVTPPTASVGQVVTLEARVSSPGNMVNSGTVSFLHGNQVLATVQVVQKIQTGALRTRFAPGNYRLTAHYNGTNAFSPGESSPQSLSVTGTEPTNSTLSATPSAKNYNFALSAFGFGFAPLGGNATLLDLSLNGKNFGSINILGPGTSTFLPGTSYPVDQQPVAIAAGDFNNDGIPDLVVANINNSIVDLLLGNGDGTFRAPKTVVMTPAPVSNGIIVGDFDGDGNLDLAVANTDTPPSHSGFSVFLGKGDGTFQTEQHYTFIDTGSVIATGDFNGDGFPDIARAITRGVIPYINQGDGTFSATRPFPAASLPSAMVSGDFNGDGLTDLAITDLTGNNVAVLLGNGDGSFAPPKTYSAGGAPNSIAVGDLNGDGKLDLVATSSADNTVNVLLGNGDGTFQPQKVFAVGNSPGSVVIADLNGDGIPDLAVANTGGNSAGVLLGNGDGTFQAQQTYTTGLLPGSIVAADFNGDGVPDLATADSQSNSASVLLGGTASSGQITNISVPGVGVQNVQGNFVPSGTVFASGLSNIVQVNGSGQRSTTTTLSSSLNPSMYLQAVTFTATVTGNIDVSPTGTVNFTADSNPICTAVTLVPGQTSSTATCSISTLAPGSHSVVASYSGDATFLASQSAPLVQVVNPVGSFNVQPISPSSLNLAQGFNNLNQPFFAQPINVTVHANSGYQGTVMLTCSVSPPLSQGSCVVNAPNSGSLANSDLNTTITINTANTTPIGSYIVTVTAEDTNHTKQSSMLALTVINNAPMIPMPSGGAGRATVTFPGPANTSVGNFACTSVSGDGINGSEDLSKIGGSCGFTPGSINLPNPVTVTISGCVVASRMNRHAPIFASLVFGIPALVLLGSLRIPRGRRKNLLRVLAFFLLASVLLLSFGCGGGSSSGGSGQFVPNAHYYVLVQGTGGDGGTYSAVVPVTVTGTSP